MQWMTYPSTLVGDPLRYPLGDHELDDPADDVGKEANDSTAEVGDGQPVAETQQGDDTSPVDSTFTEQPTSAIHTATLYTSCSNLSSILANKVLQAIPEQVSHRCIGLKR